MINTTITVDCTCYLFSPLHQYKFLLIHICPSLHKLPVFFYLSITLTWIHHRCTCVPHPEPLSHLPPYSNLQHHSSVPALSTISCIEPGLAIHFTSGNLHVSLPFSQIIPPLPFHTESKKLFYTSVSLLLSRTQGYRYHLSKFHIYALVYCIGVFLSGLLHSI